MPTKLTMQHYSLITGATARIRRQTAMQPGLNDIMAVGLLALHDAATRYSADTRIPFTSYVKQRIRGAMLDWMKKQYSTPHALPSRKLRRKVVEMPASRVSTPGEVKPTINLGLELSSLGQSLRRIADRRKERRDAVSQSVWIRSSEDPEAVHKGHLVDVSDNGMKLSLEDPMPAGAAISVECEDCVVQAKVTYCVCHSDAAGHGDWHLGIQILNRPWELVDPLILRTDKNKLRERITEDATRAMIMTNRPVRELRRKSTIVFE